MSWRVSILNFTAGAMAALISTACHPSVQPGAVALVEAPVRSFPDSAAMDMLNLRYPEGSQIILVTSAEPRTSGRVLSKGLAAAGEPAVSHDARRLLFSGKASGARTWQIYELDIPQGAPRILTSMPEGAMNPAWLPDGGIVFVSPVPKLKQSKDSFADPPALYVQGSDGSARQLTFTDSAISDPTVLSDGRILFVLTERSSSSNAATGLYTINTDGTEIRAFARPAESGARLEKPIETSNGREIVVTVVNSRLQNRTAASIAIAAPFKDWRPLFGGQITQVRSMAPAPDGELLVVAEPITAERRQPNAAVLFRTCSSASHLDAPVFKSPTSEFLGAIDLSPRRRPKGHISNVDAGKRTGLVLCFDANFTADRSTTVWTQGKKAARVRVLARAGGSAGQIRALGEVPVQSDGSFMAEVPADTPLGFETLDETGNVLWHDSLRLWVRPGENRCCLGCHEPPNRSPRNCRPLAVNAPLPHLDLADLKLAQSTQR